MQPKTIGRLPDTAQFRPKTAFDAFHMTEPRLGDGRICFILRRGVGNESCHAPEGGEGGAGGGAGGGGGSGGGAGGSGGAGGDEKVSYTKAELQAVIDGAIGKRIGEVNGKHATELKTFRDRQTELERSNSELTEKLELAGKSEADKEKILAEKAAKQLEKAAKENGEKLAKAEGERDGWRDKYLGKEIGDQLGKALDTSKVLGSARSDAIAVFRSIAKIEHDDNGKILSIEYQGIAFDSAEKAAIAFLRDRPFYASNGGQSGGGTRPGGGAGGGAGGRPLHEMSDEELLSMDSRRRQNAGAH